jgi:hypothetical protein
MEQVATYCNLCGVSAELKLIFYLGTEERRGESRGE